MQECETAETLGTPRWGAIVLLRHTNDQAESVI